MQFTTWIEAEVPRVECATHGVKQLRVPWAEPGSQFTALFERLAIDLLREWIAGAIRLLRISWDEGRGLGHQGTGESSAAWRGGAAGRKVSPIRIPSSARPRPDSRTACCP